MSDVTIDVTADFATRPFGRYKQQDGERSAEVFREDQLIPAMEKHEHVVVDLSGYNYYGSSFLEEAFGGLVRAGYSSTDLDLKLKVIHDQLPSIVEEVRAYIQAANTSKQ